jgi:hypothetical protein
VLSSSEPDRINLLKLKLLVSLLSHIPYLLYSVFLRSPANPELPLLLPALPPGDDSRLDPRLFEHYLFGGFINFPDVTPGSQLISYILNHQGDNWRDPFRDTLIKKFPKLIKTTPQIQQRLEMAGAAREIGKRRTSNTNENE